MSRCQCITTKGNKCSRNVIEGKTCCWQHEKDEPFSEVQQNEETLLVEASIEQSKELECFMKNFQSKLGGPHCTLLRFYKDKITLEGRGGHVWAMVLKTDKLESDHTFYGQNNIFCIESINILETNYASISEQKCINSELGLIIALPELWTSISDKGTMRLSLYKKKEECYLKIGYIDRGLNSEFTIWGR